MNIIVEQIRDNFLQNFSKNWHSCMIKVMIGWCDLSPETIDSGHLHDISNIQFIDHLSNTVYQLL